MSRMHSPSLVCYCTEHIDAGKSRANAHQLSDQLMRDQRSEICQIFQLSYDLKERTKASVALRKYSGKA